MEDLEFFLDNAADTLSDHDLDILLDLTDGDNTSPCCEAPVIAGFCKDCKEQV